MTHPEAKFLTAKLFDAFPGWGISDGTAETYIEHFEPLARPEALQAAIKNIIRDWSKQNAPPVAVVLEAYRAECAAHKQPEIEEFVVTEEEAAVNRKKIAALKEHMVNRNSSGHGDLFETCEHEECVWARG